MNIPATASNKHLRTFIRNIKARDHKYKAQVLVPADLDSILGNKPFVAKVTGNPAEVRNGMRMRFCECCHLRKDGGAAGGHGAGGTVNCTAARRNSRSTLR